MAHCPSVRGWWMRTTRDASLADALFRHPAFADRAPLEVALTRTFFAPFVHQEALSGPRFVRRSAWSRAALGGLPEAHVAAVGKAACERELRSGLVPSLLAAVRRPVVRATVGLTLGTDALFDVALEAVVDIDGGIKLTGRRHLELREELGRALSEVLRDPACWKGPSLLTEARAQALELSVEERVHHVASVFLATGSIQVSDVVTHALVLLAQEPSKFSLFTDCELVWEAIRRYPVNASVTRVASAPVVVRGRSFREGEAIHYVPSVELSSVDPAIGDDRSSNGWSFGVGPRACPARRFALALASEVLGAFRALGVQLEPGYEHRRSLARPVRARLGPGPVPSAPPRASRIVDRASYLLNAAETYPRAFVHAAARALRGLGGVDSADR